MDVLNSIGLLFDTMVYVSCSCYKSCCMGRDFNLILNVFLHISSFYDFPAVHNTLCYRKPNRLLRQSPDWRSEEDDRQVATCSQLGSTNRLEHAQVRPGTQSFPAKSATLAGRCRRGSVQNLRPDVQMSAHDGS